MTSGTADVVVVGAGPAGSATASLLARRGMDVVLLDRAAFPRDKPCAEYLSPEAGRILARLGVLGQIRAHAASLGGMTVVSPAGTAFTGRFAGAAPHRGFSDRGMALPRRELDAVLVAAAARHGVRLREEVRVEGVGGEDHGRRTVHFRERSGDAGAIAARFVVGADGLQSRIASQLGLARRGRLRRVAFVAHAADVPGIGDVGEMHVGRGAYVGLARVGGSLTNVAVVVPVSAVPDGTTRRQRFDAGLARLPAVAERLRQVRWVGPVLAAGPFARRTTRATADRVALVGDAADFYDPFTGEGIYAALRGAELLADGVGEWIERDVLSRTTLAAYDAARRREFGRKWLLERAIAWSIDRPALFERVAQRLAARPGMADLLVGVTGDFVPPREVLRPSYLLRLVW